MWDKKYFHASASCYCCREKIRLKYREKLNWNISFLSTEKARYIQVPILFWSGFFFTSGLRVDEFKTINLVLLRTPFGDVHNTCLRFSVKNTFPASIRLKCFVLCIYVYALYIICTVYTFYNSRIYSVYLYIYTRMYWVYVSIN